jgi:hypothetical protein
MQPAGNSNLKIEILNKHGKNISKSQAEKKRKNGNAVC